MNAPVKIPRSEVSDPPCTTTTNAPAHQLDWFCIAFLTVAVLLTLSWNAALAWLVGRAFGLW